MLRLDGGREGGERGRREKGEKKEGEEERRREEEGQASAAIRHRAACAGGHCGVEKEEKRGTEELTSSKVAGMALGPPRRARVTGPGRVSAMPGRGSLEVP